MPDILPVSGPINFPYTTVGLTMAIDKLPNLYGRLNEMNLFPSEGVSTTLVEVRFRNGYLTVLPARERGGNATVGKSSDGNSIYLEIPHIPHLDYITPEDLQNWANWAANPMRPKTLADSLNEKLQAIKNKHAITREYFRMGALKGQIVDGDGTVLHDLYERFGITKKVIYLDLDNATSNVNERCMDAHRWIEENLKGEVMSGVHALVSRELFGKLKAHPNVEKFFVNWQQAAALAGDARKGFEFGGITFEEYNASATLMSGTTGRFITAGKGHAFPVGTLQSFRTFDGPAHSLSMANMPGGEVYVSPKILDHDEGIELKSQSNPLPVCSRPELLIEFDMGAQP